MQTLHHNHDGALLTLSSRCERSSVLEEPLVDIFTPPLRIKGVSAGFSGSSMMMMSPPSPSQRPVDRGPRDDSLVTEVRTSSSVFLTRETCIQGKSRRYQPELTIARKSLPSFTAKSAP